MLRELMVIRYQITVRAATRHGRQACAPCLPAEVAQAGAVAELGLVRCNRSSPLFTST